MPKKKNYESFQADPILQSPNKDHRNIEYQLILFQ